MQGNAQPKNRAQSYIKLLRIRKFASPFFVFLCNSPKSCNLSFINECRNAFGCIDFGGKLQDVFGRDGTYTFDDGSTRALGVVVGVLLAEREGVALGIVVGNSELADNLLFCSSKARSREGRSGQALQFLSHKTEAAVDVVDIAAEVDAPPSGIGVGGKVAVDAVDKTGMLAERHIETGVHTRAAEDIVEQHDSIALWASFVSAKGGSAHNDVSLVGAFLYDAGRGNDGAYGARAYEAFGAYRAYRAHRTAPTVELAEDALPIEVASHIEDCIVGTIMGVDETAGIGGGIFAQTLGTAEDVATEGTILKKHGLEVVEDEFGRAVEVAFYLVSNDFYLFVDLRLRIGAVKDKVGKDIDGAGEIFTENGGVVDGLLFVCESIEVAAYAFEAVVDVITAAALGALKAHMLDKVGHTTVCRLLMASASADDVTAVDNVAIFMLKDDAESVVKSMGLHIRY